MKQRWRKRENRAETDNLNLKTRNFTQENKLRPFNSNTHTTCVFPHLLNEVFHLVLEPPPFELDSDQFVSTHMWTVCLLRQLFLFGKQTRIQKIANHYENKTKSPTVATT